MVRPFVCILHTVLNKSARCTFALEFVSVPQGHQRVVTFHDDLRLALSDERSRRLQHGGDTRRGGRQRHGSGDGSSRCGGGTVHVPVNSEVNRVVIKSACENLTTSSHYQELSSPTTNIHYQ